MGLSDIWRAFLPPPWSTFCKASGFGDTMRAPCFTLSPKSGPFQGHLSSVLVVPITLLQSLRRSNIKPGENVGKMLASLCVDSHSSWDISIRAASWKCSWPVVCGEKFKQMALALEILWDKKKKKNSLGWFFFFPRIFSLSIAIYYLSISITITITLLLVFSFPFSIGYKLSAAAFFLMHSSASLSKYLWSCDYHHGSDRDSFLVSVVVYHLLSVSAVWAFPEGSSTIIQNHPV